MKKCMQSLLSALVIFTIVSCAPQPKEKVDEGPTYKIVEAHMPVWEEAIKQVIELADAMPEENYSYQPHDSVRTFAEQLVHIGGSSNFIANLFLKDTRPEGAQVTASEMSKDEIKEYVESNLRSAAEVMKSMSDKQLLEEEAKSFSGNTMSRLEGLLFIHDHLTNHKAKANLYVRISGNNPPSYRYY